MNRVQSLVETPLVHLARFDHPPDCAHYDPPKETANSHSINFVERGGFCLRVGRRSLELTPSTVFVTWPGLEYRCAHQEKQPHDVCLSVTYDDGFAKSIRRELPRAARGAPRAVVPRTNRLGYLGLRLELHARRGDGLATETLAGEVLAAAAGDEPADRKTFRDAELRWYTERVEAARELLEAQYAEPHSLGALSRYVGMSRFHFARVFRALVGKPPHRYLLEVRLRRAAERLSQGASVTATCFDCGLGSVSHFIRMFRRHFGVTPSRYPGI